MPAPGRSTVLAKARTFSDLLHHISFLRPDYGPRYYAAFVVDPDGHHIEAVFNLPE